MEWPLFRPQHLVSKPEQEDRPFPRLTSYNRQIFDSKNGVPGASRELELAEGSLGVRASSVDESPAERGQQYIKGDRPQVPGRQGQRDRGSRAESTRRSQRLRQEPGESADGRRVDDRAGQEGSRLDIAQPRAQGLLRRGGPARAQQDGAPGGGQFRQLAEGLHARSRGTLGAGHLGSRRSGSWRWTGDGSGQ